jgi:hypothetical protein
LLRSYNLPHVRRTGWPAYSAFSEWPIFYRSVSPKELRHEGALGRFSFEDIVAYGVSCTMR